VSELNNWLNLYKKYSCTACKSACRGNSIKMKLIKNDNMKNLCFIILTLIFVSCSNDEETNNNNNSSNDLLKKIIYYNYTNFGTEIYKSKELNIYYTNENKIDYVKVECFGPNCSGDIATIKYQYSGNLITSKQRFINNTAAAINDYFEYDNQNRVVKYKRYHYPFWYEYTYEYLSNGNIKVTKFDQLGINFIPTDSYEMTLDQNQNIISYSSSNGTSTYDNKVSAINGIIGMDKIYFIDQLSDDTFYLSYSNNKISTYGIDSQGFNYQYNYSYEYNANNKPTKKYIDNKLYVEYEY